MLSFKMHHCSLVSDWFCLITAQLGPLSGVLQYKALMSTVSWNWTHTHKTELMALLCCCQHSWNLLVPLVGIVAIHQYKVLLTVMMINVHEFLHRWEWSFPEWPCPHPGLTDCFDEDVNYTNTTSTQPDSWMPDPWSSPYNDTFSSLHLE